MTIANLAACIFVLIVETDSILLSAQTIETMEDIGCSSYDACGVYYYVMN